ncbi:hypothetical protein Nepgr_031532 [Nepenthes gracilis]|uniref:Uncharacterized protein n=1 Tax=Nepenthes gracilis TaxID=150966 RepID=A0AAD3TIG9_NEPGR|nr:hypothetical protein Nepgr_031532 [Nepenthes gracilis]
MAAFGTVRSTTLLPLIAIGLSLKYSIVSASIPSYVAAPRTRYKQLLATTKPEVDLPALDQDDWAVSLLLYLRLTSCNLILLQGYLELQSNLMAASVTHDPWISRYNPLTCQFANLPVQLVFNVQPTYSKDYQQSCSRTI